MAVWQLHNGNADGAQLGRDVNDKVGFFGATPVVQQAAITDATSGDAHTQLNDLISKLTSLGLLESNS